MKKRVRLGISLLLAAVLVVSVVLLVRQQLEYRRGEEMYEEAEALVELPDLSELPEPEPEAPEEETEAEEKPVYVDPYADALRNMDFTALREVNDDVLGWILIPNTVLSYPLVQGDDNDYYLNHTWKKWTSVVGAIFMESANSPDLDNFNTIIYGHRMNNGSMFASLKYYKSLSYWTSHPCVYITNDAGSHQYEIFAAYEVSTQGQTYRLQFPDTQARQDFIDYCLDQSVIDTGVVPNTYDRILTLSTCTGNGHATRWVVQAVLRGEAPSDAVEQEPAQPEQTPQTDAPESAPEEAGSQTPETVPDQTQEPPASGEDQETDASSLLDIALGSVTGGDASQADGDGQTPPAQ